MTPSGIEPETFRFVAKHLNQCATAVPDKIKIYRNFSVIRTPQCDRFALTCSLFLASERVVLRKMRIYEANIPELDERFVCCYNLLCEYAKVLRTRCSTFRHRASCILGQAFRYSPENAFYIFNQQVYFII
jgi:hypothetical protein